MAQGGGAAVDVDLLVRQLEVGHGGHGDHREGLVDFVEVHVLGLPAGLGEEVLQRAHGGGGEPVRLLRVLAVGDDARQRFDAELFSGGCAHQHHGGRAVGNRRGVGGGDGAVLLEGGLERGDLFRHGLGGGFVGVDHRVALAAGDGDGRDFPLEAAVFRGGAGAAQRFQRERVLLFAREGILGGAIFSEHAHGLALVVGVFQAIQGHVVVHGVVAVTVALAALEQQVRGVAHAFLAAGDDDVGGARGEQIMAEHGGLQARAADLVDGGASHTQRQACAQRGLARRGLALAGLQHVAHDDFFDLLGLDAGAFDGGLDGDRAQLVRGQAGQGAQHAAHGRAGDGNDDDGI